MAKLEKQFGAFIHIPDGIFHCIVLIMTIHREIGSSRTYESDERFSFPIWILTENAVAKIPQFNPEVIS